MSVLFKRIADSETFQTVILALILLNGISMGLETNSEILDQYNGFFLTVFVGSQIIFVIEILIRLAAFAPRFREFFSDRWNTFDFVIVALSLLPAVGGFATVARLLRVLRVLRALAVSDRLRGFIGRLSESFDEVIYSSLLVLLSTYIFAISGFYVFAEVSPDHWGGLGAAMLTNFYLLLLQDIPSIVNPLIKESGSSIVYFILFYIVHLGLVLSVVNAAISQSLRGKDD